MPAIIGRLQATGGIDLCHHHLSAKGFCCRGNALSHQTVANDQHFLLMQRQMSRLEEGMPGRKTHHMAVMQSLFNREIVPVKDRVAGTNIAQAADAGAGCFQTGDDVAKFAALVQQGGDIGAHFTQMGRAPGDRFFPGVLPVGIAHVAPGAGLCAALYQPGDNVVLNGGGVTGGQKDFRSFLQYPLHQRNHFHIQMHAAGQADMAQIGKGGDLTQRARHILAGPCHVFH